MCKVYRIISQRKHERFNRKNYNQISEHEHETSFKVNNKQVLPCYSKSKCQKALIFRGIKLWNTTPNDIKQSANLAKFNPVLGTCHSPTCVGTWGVCAPDSQI